MELILQNNSTRLILERADNGLIVYDVGEDGVVESKVLYEIYFKDGILDLHHIITMMAELMENLQIPLAEEETNRTIAMGVTKIDPDKPSILDEEETEDGDDES